jgi:hypothetical protein
VERCWASVLSDCEGPLSDEHIVTAGLFEDPLLKVSGFDWCDGGIREIPRDRLVRRILCRSHNGRLSPLDRTAVRSARVFDEWLRVENARAVAAGKPKRWSVAQFEIDGRELERWLLKTTINATYDKGKMIGPTAVEAGKPTEELVRIAYGLDSFKDRRGLYILAAQGYTGNNTDRISLIPWGHSEVVNGMAINFRGFILMLCLIPEGMDIQQALDMPLRAMDPEQKVDRMKLNPMLHPKAFISRSGKYVSSKITFKW